MQLKESNYNALVTTEDQAISLLQRLRWGHNPISPFDILSPVYRCSNGFKCKHSGKYFTVKTNTIFHGSQIPLLTWFKAIEFLLADNNVTSLDIANHCKISHRTATTMLSKLRRQFEIYKTPSDLPRNIEVDLGAIDLNNWLKLFK